MIIHVTKEDIKNGLPCNPSRCPVAQALERTFNQHVSVGRWSWNFTDNYIDGETNSYALPKEVSAWIWRFDRTLYPLEPFSFEVEIEDN